MKLNIEIKTDNAAFDDYPRREVTRILRELAAKTERGIYYDGRDVPLYDPEGNKVGFCKIFLKKGNTNEDRRTNNRIKSGTRSK